MIAGHILSVDGATMVTAKGKLVMMLTNVFALWTPILHNALKIRTGNVNGAQIPWEKDHATVQMWLGHYLQKNLSVQLRQCLKILSNRPLKMLLLKQNI